MCCNTSLTLKDGDCNACLIFSYEVSTNQNEIIAMKMLIKCYKTFIYFDKFNVHSYNEAFLFENNDKNRQKFPLCNIEIFLL